MVETEKPWAKDKLKKLNEILRQLGVGEVKIVERAGVRVGVAGQVPEAVLEELAGLFPDRPKGVNNCFDVSEYLMDSVSNFDTIMTKEASSIVNGNHCINFGQGLIVDMTISSYFGDLFDVLAIQLAPNSSHTVDSYIAMANTVYGGDWKYLGKAGHNELRNIQEAAIRELREKFGD